MWKKGDIVKYNGDYMVVTYSKGDKVWISNYDCSVIIKCPSEITTVSDFSNVPVTLIVTSFRIKYE